MSNKQKEKYLLATGPRLNSQTLQQLGQIKSFVDSSLREAMSLNFETEQERTQYFIRTIQQLRDYLFAEITENSLRARLIQEFKKIDEENVINQDGPVSGNERIGSEGFVNEEDPLAQDPSDSEIKEKRNETKAW